LHVPHDRVGLKHQVIAAVVELRLEDFEAPRTLNPQMLHHLAGKQVLQKRLAM
jgi:hypothetical protein